MRNKVLIGLGLLLALVVALPADPPAARTSIDVLFSPNGGCTERIVREIDAARRTIRVQAYSFTSAPISKAVLEAKKRGVACQVILDKSQETQQYSEVDFFFNQGIPTWIDAKHAIAHNKIILIDDETVITGSFNFTRAAEESNAENLLVIKGHADIAAKYRRNFDVHLEHARKYEGRAARGAAAGDSAKETPTKGGGATDVVFVTRSGTTYHTAGCYHLSKSPIRMTLKEAARKYTPCSRCKPPTLDR